MKGCRKGNRSCREQPLRKTRWVMRLVQWGGVSFFLFESPPSSGLPPPRVLFFTSVPLSCDSLRKALFVLDDRHCLSCNRSGSSLGRWQVGVKFGSVPWVKSRLASFSLTKLNPLPSRNISSRKERKRQDARCQIGKLKERRTVNFWNHS